MPSFKEYLLAKIKQYEKLIAVESTPHTGTHNFTTLYSANAILTELKDLLKKLPIR